MLLTRILAPEVVRFETPGLTKWAAIEQLVACLVRHTGDAGAGELLSAVVAREQQGSTGLPNGVAIPHARSEHVKGLSAALGLSRHGIDFDCEHRTPVHVVCLVVSPPRDSGRYLNALAELASLSFAREAMSAVHAAHTATEVMDILCGYR